MPAEAKSCLLQWQVYLMQVRGVSFCTALRALRFAPSFFTSTTIAEVGWSVAVPGDRPDLRKQQPPRGQPDTDQARASGPWLPSHGK